jgi:NNP family nitrate/nitrite transporter-like MFS transporter
VGEGRWIERWEPENPVFWEARGKAIARRNLIFSIFTEHIGFSVWLLWSIVVVRMYGTPSAGGTIAPAESGWALTASQGLTLLAVTSGAGALLRVPYTFAVPIVGGRNWTVISALLLVVPCLGMAWVVKRPDTPFWLLASIASTAGFGGGNFASSMSNISFFYPDKDKGWALGLNAAGGNIGVAVAQKLVPVVAAVGGGLALSNAGLLYVPLAIIAAAGAYFCMDNLRVAKADLRPTLRAFRHPHTWMMACLYIGTFGSFIGYSAAFPTLLKLVFDRGDIALSWGFLGALVGSFARPVGGKLADKHGGSMITVIAFVIMALAGALAVVVVQHEDLPLFFLSFMLLFIAAGIGNGATYRMIPAIFRRLAAQSGSGEAHALEYKRQAAGAVGIIAAIGAFGGFVIPLVYAWSKSTYGTILPALQTYIALFLVMAVATWVCYLRHSAAMRGV